MLGWCRGRSCGDRGNPGLTLRCDWNRRDGQVVDGCRCCECHDRLHGLWANGGKVGENLADGCAFDEAVQERANWNPSALDHQGTAADVLPTLKVFGGVHEWSFADFLGGGNGQLEWLWWLSLKMQTFCEWKTKS